MGSTHCVDTTAKQNDNDDNGSKSVDAGLKVLHLRGGGAPGNDCKLPADVDPTAEHRRGTPGNDKDNHHNIDENDDQITRKDENLGTGKSERRERYMNSPLR